MITEYWDKTEFALLLLAELPLGLNLEERIELTESSQL